MATETILELFTAHPKTYNNNLLIPVQNSPGGAGSTGAIQITDIVSFPNGQLAFGDSSDIATSSANMKFDSTNICLSLDKNGTAAFDSTAILKLETDSQLFYITSLTTAQRTAITPSREGAVTWDSDLNRLVVWSGGGYDVFQGMAYQDPSTVSIIDGNGHFTNLSSTNFSTTALDNTPIGVTTPAEGHFTNLTASSIENSPLGTSVPAAVYASSFKCNQNVFSNMERGLTSLGTISYGTVSSATVTVSATFGGAPNVVCTPTAGATSDPNIAHVSCGIYNISVNQFEINCTINDPTAPPIGSVDVAWFAFE